MAAVRSLLRGLALAAAGSSLFCASTADATPAPCTSASSERALQTFLTAFNRGDQPALRDAIAPAKQFGWYSVSAPGGRLTMQVAASYSSLFPYFRVRHRQHERMRETRFRFNGIEQGTRPGGARFAGLQFTVSRQAADVPSVLVSGKGAVVCSAPNRLAVWSLASSTLPGMGPLDPNPLGP